MTGLGGLNKTPNGVVIGLVQMQLPNVVTPADLKAQAERVAALVGKARRSSAAMDLIVFPEYSLHGLSMDTNPAIMCSLDGPEVALLRATCREQRIWGCFSLMELNPAGYPYNSGIIVDDRGGAQALLSQAASVGAGRSPGNRATWGSRCVRGPMAASWR